MKNSLIFILLISPFFLLGQHVSEKAIDEIFSKWDKPNSPGCSIGVFKDNEFLFSKSYGLANMEHNIPNTDSTVFRIASTSKQFTAACIVLLAQKKQLRLRDNLKSIFPDFPAYAERITIRQLLNHTSGIRDYLQIADLKGLRNDDYYDDGQIMNWLVNQSNLNFEPGEEFLYSNSGYWLLSEIVHKVAGMNLAEFAKKEIFIPLGMRSTHFHNVHNQIVKNRASGYAPMDNDNFEISMTTLEMIGDGGLFTTIQDLKKWDDAYYQSSVLDRAFWNEMTQQAVLNSGETIEYASGLQIGNYEGLKTISHSGSFVGFNAELMRFPDQKLSIAILANTDGFNAAWMAYHVADVVLKDHFKTAEAESIATTPEKPFINLKTEELERFNGYYWDDASAMKRRIYVKEDTLRYSRNEYNESDLLPIAKNEFRMINVSSKVIVKFDMEDKYAMKVRVNDGKIFRMRAFAPQPMTRVALSKYTGNYYSQELDVNYHIALADNALQLSINDQPKSALNPALDNIFTNDDIGVFNFIVNSNGRITGFTLAAGRVKNLKFTKQ